MDIWTQKYPELVKEIVARGHEIGNHSTSHPQMSKLNETQIAKELNTQADNVLAIAGVRPVLFRPPYGDYNNRVITTARAQGFVPSNGAWTAWTGKTAARRKSSTAPPR